MTSAYIREQLRQLPDGPGVYLMKDAEGNILYVGKAASLRDRVRSYFVPRENLIPKLQRLVDRVHDLDFFVTNSEQEALILELNLIKRHHPHYNVRLKDDKTFPYLKISLNEDWPKVFVTRRLEQDGGHYFGPFASAKSVRQTLKVIKRLFPFRSCTRPITGADPRACLEYFVHNCVAPCIGAVGKEEYGDVIKQVVLFLEGKEESVIQKLENEMQLASEGLNFEKAALLRDQIQGVKRVVEGQKIAARIKGEQDVIALATDKDQACVQVFFIRNGKLIGRESFTLQGTSHEKPSRIMTSFVQQFYASSASIPPLLLLQHPLEDVEVIKGWLQNKRGNKVAIQVPLRGERKLLVDTVAENARQSLEQMKIKHLATPAVLNEALTELQEKLQLGRQPERIEGYDISDIQGTAAVGSMVVFEKGKPRPAHYRRFRIKTIPGANDYAMLQEVLARRFKRSASKESEGTWAIMPDLVLIDGGKGQLNAALGAMEKSNADSVPVASLAKEREEIFVPKKSKPIILPGNSPGLQLLQRVRDEAHRFALGYHQRVHKREAFTSSLDGIPGIGLKRKRALLKHFGSIRSMREASAEELATASGMTKALAQKVKGYL